MTGLELFGVAAGVVSIIAAVGAWVQAGRATVQARRLREDRDREEARLGHALPIVLARHDGADAYALPAPIRRRDVARAEILGRLGMVRRTPAAYAHTRGFVLHWTSEAAFLRELDRVRGGDDPADRVTIVCLPTYEDDRDVFAHEFDQFDLAAEATAEAPVPSLALPDSDTPLPNGPARTPTHRTRA